MHPVKVLLPFFFIAIAHIGFAQSKDQVWLKDSACVSGKVFIRKDQLTLTRASAKPAYYSIDQVLSFRRGTETFEVVKDFYVRLTNGPQKLEHFKVNAAWAKVLVQGQVCLYEYTFYVKSAKGRSMLVNKLPASGKPEKAGWHRKEVPDGRRPVAFTCYLLKPANCDLIVMVPPTHQEAQFREEMSNYFGAFEGLAYRISMGEQTHQHMEQIVHSYNQWLNKNPNILKLLAHKAEQPNRF